MARGLLTGNPPPLLVYLDAAQVDVGSCAAVMSHLRGRLLATTLGSFVRAAPTTLVDVPLGHASMPPPRCMPAPACRGLSS